MSKVTFEFDDIDKYKVVLCIHSKEMASMLDGITTYIKNLNKYEVRESLPTREVSDALEEIISNWYFISGLEE